MQAVLGLIGNVFNAIAKILPFLFAWRGGRAAAQRDAAKAAASAKDAQLDAAARPHAGRDDILGRMRRDDL